MKYYVYPYKQGSKSAELVARKLGGKVIKLEGSRFRPGLGKAIINWGNSNCIFRAINASAGIASNKLRSFNALKAAGVSIPPFTTDKAEAAAYPLCVVRKKLNGHSGEGIELVERGNPLPDAPLYVQYIKKKAEFRVHVYQGRVIHVQQKKKKEGHVPNKIRSHANGYVFAINDLVVPPSVESVALAAVPALGLTFGAVDVIFNEQNNQAYVLEVNSAPGLSDTTATKYAEAIKG